MFGTSPRPENQRTISEFFPLTPKVANKSKVDISLFLLPNEILQKIFNSLDHSSLLHLEMCNQSCQKYTVNAWQNLKVKNHFNFNWKMTQKEANPHKWDYCISCALHQYILIDKYPLVSTKHYPSSNDFVSAQGIHAKFGGLIKRFPILGSYIGVDIKYLVDSIDLPVKKKTIRKFNETVLEGKYAGELLLKGLISSRESNSALTGHLFLQAIKKQATCASLFAIELLKCGPYSSGNQIIQWNLATESAILDDDRALVKLIERDGSAFLLSQAIEKFELKEFQAAEKLYTSVLTIDVFPKATMLAMLATTKQNLEKWDEADKMYTLAIESKHNENLPYDVFISAAETKSFLGQWEEAERLYIQAISCTPASVIDTDLNISRLGALIKYGMRKWEDADRLYEKALKAYGVNVPVDVLAGAALVKGKLNQS